MPAVSVTDYAYLAGFLDGEGLEDFAIREDFKVQLGALNARGPQCLQ